MQILTPLLAAAILATTTVAHPGHDHAVEAAERASFLSNNKRDLSHCAAKLKARGVDSRAVARRAAKAQEERKKRNILADSPFLAARDVDTALATDHKSKVNYTASVDSSVIFSGNTSCILSPEVTQGPYWVEGEYVREDVREKQEGVELILDTQLIDMTTCEPVTNAVVEIWACNSTGVYSGVVASGNGDSSDASNLNATFLRGLQPVGDDGVAQFTTLVPGHYTGRTTHIHVIAHFNGTSFENGTYAGGYASHIGQLFFDQDLITQVELTAPYNANTQTLTTNAEDSIFSTEAAGDHDPVVNYSLLGDTVDKGVFAWIAFGIDLTQQNVLAGAATLTESGGVANSNSGAGGSGGPPSGGTPPSFPGGTNGTNATIPVAPSNGTTSVTSASSTFVTSTAPVSSASAVSGAAGQARGQMMLRIMLGGLAALQLVL